MFSKILRAQRLNANYAKQNFILLTKCHKTTAIIIGGGPIGSFTALALQKQGINCLIYEKTDGSKALGGSLNMNGGTACFKYLGYENEFNQISSFNAGMKWYSMNGNNILVDLDMNKVHQISNINSRWVTRSTLYTMLKDLCVNTNNIEYNVNKTFIDFAETDKNITAYFNDGTSINGDILIGTDGVNSKVRQCIIGNEMNKKCKQFSGFRFWSFVGHLSKNFNMNDYITENNGCIMKTELHDNCFSFAFPNISTNEYAILFGYRSLRSNDSDDSDVDNIINDNIGWGKSTHNEFYKWYNQYDMLSPHLINGIDNANQITHINCCVIDLNELKWSEGRKIILGDAAHAMTPFGAPGLNHGLYDAMCLANLIKNKLNNNNINTSIWNEIFKEMYDIRCTSANVARERSIQIGNLMVAPKEIHQDRDEKIGKIITNESFGNMFVPQCGFSLN